MKLIMNQEHSHPVYGKAMRAGETFDVPDNEAVVWIKSGRARVAPTRSLMTKDEETLSEPAEEKEKKSGRYNRRDMRAEEK